MLNFRLQEIFWHTEFSFFSSTPQDYKDEKFKQLAIFFQAVWTQIYIFGESPNP